MPNVKSRLLRIFRTFGLRKEVYFLIENLSVLLSAGMDISSALASIREEITSSRMQEIIREVEDEVRGGSSLSRALEKAQVLSSRILSLIRLGEKSGRLTENLKVIALQNEKEALFRSRIRSSLMYAVIVFTLTIVVGVGTAWFTLPKLASFFKELEAELPPITKALITIGGILRKYGAIIIPLFLLLIGAAFYFLFSFPKTKFIGHLLLFKAPLIKNLIKQVEIARFGFLLGSMIQAGMPTVESLDAMRGTTTFLNYRKFYIYLKEKVEEGNSFKKSFNLYPDAKKLFPSSVRQMIIAAEQSGTLSETLLRIGKMFEQKTEITARDLPILLEPILLVIVGLMVALLALGTILPIYSLIDIL